MKTKPPANTLSWLSLFSSTGTLICCALPIVLVTLGLGASVAALTNAFPFLIFLSIHKAWVFFISGLLLTFTAWLIYRPARTCPSDSQTGDLCTRAHIWNLRIFCLSTLIWVTGFIAAFLALPLRIFFES
ncbi:MAG: hypothetical protein L3J24_00150 [Xanthomonadales bacterium]|nr:hypothetical protein [Xanthomonadales bacterium]